MPQYKIKRLKFKKQNKVERESDFAYYSLILSPLSPLFFLTFLLLVGGLVTQLCPTLVTPWTVARQAPLSVGFSRQEYWSGLPFPSPGDLPDPGIKPRSPALQADSLPAEPQGKPKNTGVGSLSFLQRIFLTLELNQGLLNYRQTLYQLSYQWSGHLGSPVSRWSVTKSLCNEYVCLQ